MVVTGMGMVTAIGVDQARTFRNLLDGVSGVRPLDIAHGERLRDGLGAQIHNLPPPKTPPTFPLDRFAILALAAADEAWTQSSLVGAFDPESGVVYWGTGLGGAATLEKAYADLFLSNAVRTSPYSVVNAMPHAAAANIALRYGIKGACLSYATACASSAIAIGEAFRAVQSGAAEVALAGGAEAALTFGVMKSWQSMMASAVPDASRPETSCRPFAKDRTGLVPGEGAGTLVLEAYEHAAARGAPMLAELVGYGVSNDATHLSGPNAQGQARAMSAALRESARHGIGPGDIGYLNAHGTGTLIGDRIETESIKLAFGEHARALPISSTKALHGHLLGAGGVVEFIVSILAMRDAVAPPTAHLWHADPQCDLDYIALTARPLSHPRAVMSNSFAFGGSNAVLIAKCIDT